MSAIQEGKIPQLKDVDITKLIPAELLKSLPPANDVIKSITPLIETAARIAKSTDFSKVCACVCICVGGGVRGWGGGVEKKGVIGCEVYTFSGV
jgi:hypothetical protein